MSIFCWRKERTPPDPDVGSSPVSAKGSNFCRFWIAELATHNTLAYVHRTRSKWAKRDSGRYHVLGLVMARYRDECRERETYTYNCGERVCLLVSGVIQEMWFDCGGWRDGRWIQRVRWRQRRREHSAETVGFTTKKSLVCGCARRWDLTDGWRYLAWLIGQ